MLPKRCRPLRSIVAATLVALVMTIATGDASGQEDDSLSWDRKIHGLVGRYCVHCHDGDDPSGNVDLTAEHPGQIREQFETWQNALQALRDEAMPPDDERQPSAEERDLMIRFLESTLLELDCDQVDDPGRPILRRLNRTEYDLTVLDLTGLDLRLADSFPPDPSSYGFPNNGDALTLAPVQVEQYDLAAQQIVAALLAGSPDADDPSDASVEAFRRLFAPALDDRGAWSLDDPESAARAILSDFATRAYRRPVEPEQSERLMTIFRRAREAERPFPDSIGLALRGILISPRFLIRIERTEPDAIEPYPVDPYDLASRLSYFLWSRPPDAALLERAADGSLQDPEVLRAETLRMLRDDRSDALVEHFFGQWLDLRAVATHQPDRERFPEFDEALRGSMLAETRAVLAEMIREDRPYVTILDADFTYVDARLAQLYGLEGEFDERLTRVSLTDRRRGGVLTSAALLMTQSDPQRVNVPRRGNFIAGRILGSPPPPPPPDVPPLDEATADDGSLTLRERFERHRSRPECMGCHSKIDPLGFALQNFDAIGRWNDVEAGKPIDASGTLPDGRSFDGPEAFKELLLAERETFARTLSENLLIYALGRGLHPSDRCTIDRMLEASREKEGAFSELIVQIVLSRPFRYRRNPED
ncbi:MAG TPA: hypothetical protein DCQ98_21890 [Planctomycetaceae bacterium]|nr:hypothetical protein [Planctomycetaceae bacterium]